MKKFIPGTNTIYIFLIIIIYTSLVQKLGIKNTEKIGSIIIPLLFIPYLNGELNRNGLEKNIKKKIIIISSLITFLITILLTISIFKVPTIPLIPNIFYMNNALIWGFIYSSIIISLYKAKKIKNWKLWLGSIGILWFLIIILAVI